jgi:hypothetical protein
MINFFRKIRQQLLTENKFSKYLIYAIGEIVLVVIGILIALQVNNWNEERKESKQKAIILTNLKSDFEADISRIGNVINFLDERRIRASLLLGYLRNLPIEIDSVNTLLLIDRVSVLFNYRPTLATYKEIKGAGTLRLIDSDTLKTKLALYQGLIESSIQVEDFNSPILKKFENLVIKHMDEGLGKIGVFGAAPDSYKLIRFDLGSMSKDEELINTLKSIVNISNKEKWWKNVMIKSQAEGIVKLIERELK